MKNYLNTHLLVAGNALALALIVSGTAWYIHQSRMETLNILQSNIETQAALITELAVLTDRNGADEVTEMIISDCPRRTEFENQLMTLNTATKKELLSTQQLFESCGAFYAERKALMVSRLEREFQSLQSNLALLKTIRDLTPEEGSLANWRDLIKLEKTRSMLLSEQTAIQEEIISLLISGTNTQSRITTLVQNGQNVNQSLSVTDSRIDALSTTLTK
jgi:hypothetical protein